MITLPPSPDERTMYSITEAADIFFGRSDDWFRERLLDTGIVEKNPWGMIWASDLKEDAIKKRMETLGLNLKLTTAAKFKVVKKG